MTLAFNPSICSSICYLDLHAELRNCGIELPHSPNQARVEVIGENAAQLWWLQPEMDSGGITTKFKGTFSPLAAFSPFLQPRADEICAIYFHSSMVYPSGFRGIGR